MEYNSTNKTNEANLKIDRTLNDMPESQDYSHMTKAEIANNKINDGKDPNKNEITPTYLYNNTPAIKITDNDN